jgi:hypothetical protein
LIARFWNELREMAWLIGAVAIHSLSSIGVAGTSLLLLNAVR